jgi:LCP family protein required for cell wall assembly
MWSSARPYEPLSADDLPPSRGRQRRWYQRLLLVVNLVVILACFVGALALVVARNIGNSIGRVEIATPPTQTLPTPPPTTQAPQTTAPASPSSSVGTTIPPTTPPETFPPADPTARNFLITGADNNACIDPNSPYASAFGNREGMGERSDTIMLMRVDPATGRAAVLSFPRDLWVEIAGRGSKQRINTAYVKDDPQRLIDTIFYNFGLPVDHFIQVDFCAFKNIVDAVGGVKVPFTYPARDKNTGLNVPTAGCFTFDGDHALAYVRSRKYQYQVDGTWRSDSVSDLGRVSRQQDFIRRAMSAALDKGVLNPSVARGLIKTAEENVVVDDELTPRMMLEFVGVLRDLDPTAVASYQVESSGANMGGASVLIPQLESQNMKRILAVFRGEAPLAGALELGLVPTTTVGPASPDTTLNGPSTTLGADDGTSTTTGPGSASTTTGPGATTSLPPTAIEVPEENTKGIVPPRDVQC